MPNEELTIDQFYEKGLAGKLLGLRCEAGHITVPPRHSCRVCKSSHLQVVELSGRGQVVSFTTVHVKAKEFPLETPYTLAFVNLAEGGNIMGVISTSQAGVEIGSQVSVNFRYYGTDKRWPRIFFELI